MEHFVTYVRPRIGTTTDVTSTNAQQAVGGLQRSRWWVAGEWKWGETWGCGGVAWFVLVRLLLIALKFPNFSL